jgi:hypothetical protein
MPKIVAIVTFVKKHAVALVGGLLAALVWLLFPKQMRRLPPSPKAIKKEQIESDLRRRLDEEEAAYHAVKHLPVTNLAAARDFLKKHGRLKDG